MQEKRKTKKTGLGALELAQLACQIAEEKKALQPIGLDVIGLTSLCSYFVIASCKFKAQVKGLSNSIIAELKEKGSLATQVEGSKGGAWVLLDYGDVLINVMHQPERDLYQLEEIWRKAKEIEF